MKNRVKELREQRSISQLCLATHVGCSQNTISKIELGITNPKGELLIELSKFFNVSIDYLLYNSTYKYVQEMYTSSRRLEEQYLDILKLFDGLSSRDKETIYFLVQRLANSNDKNGEK